MSPRSRAEARRMGKPWPCRFCKRKRLLSASGQCSPCGRTRMLGNLRRVKKICSEIGYTMRSHGIPAGRI